MMNEMKKMKKEEIALINLFEKWSKKNAVSIDLLPESGSYRKYFRIRTGREDIIGVYNEDRKENNAFISFTRHFLKEVICIPIPACTTVECNNLHVSHHFTNPFSHEQIKKPQDTFLQILPDLSDSTILRTLTANGVAI